ncbi:MAG: phosphatase PAP2 family protein [Candidatus Saccharimonadales bacterium]
MISHIHSLLNRQNLFSRRALTIAVLFIAGLALFLTVYDGVQEKEDLASFDLPLLTWMIANQNQQLTTAMTILTDIMSPIGVSIMTLAGGALWAWRTKDYWRPALLTGAVALAFVLSAIIKTFTARQRPTLTDLVDMNAAISYSFPSGHVIGTAVLLLVLAYFFCIKKPTFHRLLTWSIATIIGITLVAFSRIYLGYHWLTDVVASVGLAMMILAIVIAVDTYADVRRRAISKAV